MLSSLFLTISWASLRNFSHSWSLSKYISMYSDDTWSYNKLVTLEKCYQKVEGNLSLLALSLAVDNNLIDILDVKHLLEIFAQPIESHLSSIWVQYQFLAQLFESPIDLLKSEHIKCLIASSGLGGTFLMRNWAWAPPKLLLFCRFLLLKFRGCWVECSRLDKLRAISLVRRSIN